MTMQLKKRWNKLRHNHNFRLVLAALPPCLVALLVYCCICHLPQPFPDSRDYLDLSRSLVENGQFKFSFDTTANGEESIIRTPGYPVQIAAARFLAGDHGFIIVNLLSLFGIVFFSLKIAEKLGIRSRHTLMVLFLLSPGLLACTVSALTEVPFAFWLTLGVYLLLCKHPGWAGAALGMGTLIRPAGIYLFIIPALWLMAKRKFFAAAIFIIAANVLPLAWTMRNYVQFGQPVYTTLDGHYLLDYKAGSYLSWRDNVPWEKMYQQLESQLPSQASPIERNLQAGALGKQILKDHAISFILWTPRNLVYFLLPDITPLLERLELASGNRGTLDILRRQGPLAAVNFYFSGNPVAAAITAVYCVFYAMTLLLILLGIWALWRHRQRLDLLLMLGIIAYLWVLPVGNLDWRFRMPAAALLFVIIAAGVSFLWTSRHKILDKIKKITSC